MCVCVCVCVCVCAGPELGGHGPRFPTNTGPPTKHKHGTRTQEMYNFNRQCASIITITISFITINI